MHAENQEIEKISELYTNENGLKIVSVLRSNSPVVALQAWVKVGSADEEIAEGGLAHVHEHMLFKGTHKRGVGEIASDIEALGGEINAWTSFDQTVYHIVVAAEYFDQALEILADAVCHSVFDKEELEKELEVILEEIKRSEDQAESKVSRELFSLSFEKHPYRLPVIGFSEVVANFKREQILDFYKKHYCQDRITLLTVGPIAHHDIQVKLEQAFKDLPIKAGEKAKRVQEDFQSAAKVSILKDDVQDSHLAVSFRAPAMMDEDLAAVDVLASILGQGKSSRLYKKIFREKELVNQVYAYAYTPEDLGLFVIGARLKSVNAEATLAQIFEEILKIQTEGVVQSELSKVQKILCSDAIYQQQSVEGTASRVGYWAVLKGDADYENIYQQKVREVSIADLQKVAAKYLDFSLAKCVFLYAEKDSQEVDEHSFEKYFYQQVATFKKRTEAFFLEKSVETTKAQQQSSIKKQEQISVGVRRIRKKARSEMIQLEDGPLLVVEEDFSIPLVVLRTAFMGGTRSEQSSTRGYSNLMAYLLTRGTKARSAQQISEEVAQLAGDLSAVAGRNSVKMQATFLKTDFSQGFEIYKDCLSHSSFDSDEITRMANLLCERIENKNDQPASIAFEVFLGNLFDQHPYRNPVIGEKKILQAATQESLQDFYQKRVSIRHGVTSISGDIEIEEAKDYMLQALEQEKAVRIDTVEQPALWSPKVEAAIGEIRVRRKIVDKEQSHLIFGFRGLKFSDDDRFALAVINAILGGQGGRLFLELRDKRSLCYSVSSFSVEGMEPGYFASYIAASPHKIDEALKGMQEILFTMKASSVGSEELLRAQRYLIGSHGISLQKIGARASTMIYNALYGMDYDAHLQYAEKIKAVCPEQILKVAQRIFTEDDYVVSIVGSKETTGPQGVLIS